MDRLRLDADRIARHFHLTYREISPERANVRRRYGACFSDGRILVRLSHAKTGEALKYSSLINTICHEMAHLRHFNHGPRFKAFYFELVDYARREGIYRPGKTPLPPAEGSQMSLFGKEPVLGEDLAGCRGGEVTESVSPAVVPTDEKG